MARFRYRVIDDAGSELGFVDLDEPLVDGDDVSLPDLGSRPVIEVYDDEDGKEGGVDSTLVVEGP